MFEITYIIPTESDWKFNLETMEEVVETIREDFELSEEIEKAIVKEDGEVIMEVSNDGSLIG